MKIMNTQDKQIARDAKRRRIILRGMLRDYMRLPRRPSRPFVDVSTGMLYKILEKIRGGDMKCFAGGLFRATLDGLAREPRPYVQLLPVFDGEGVAVWRIRRSPATPQRQPAQSGPVATSDAYGFTIPQPGDSQSLTARVRSVEQTLCLVEQMVDGEAALSARLEALEARVAALEESTKEKS